mmetsp:Transcript_77873/g.232021  ORF Transcript_77873/g.232021 Transcript_77873/m.232021 type:complete len:211 (-) Transcript_77873:9-641(-)
MREPVGVRVRAALEPHRRGPEPLLRPGRAGLRGGRRGHGARRVPRRAVAHALRPPRDHGHGPHGVPPGEGRPGRRPAPGGEHPRRVLPHRGRRGAAARVARGDDRGGAARDAHRAARRARADRGARRVGGRRRQLEPRGQGQRRHRRALRHDHGGIPGQQGDTGHTRAVQPRSSRGGHGGAGLRPRQCQGLVTDPLHTPMHACPCMPSRA